MNKARRVSSAEISQSQEAPVGAVIEGVNELVGIGGIPLLREEGGRDIEKIPRSDL